MKRIRQSNYGFTLVELLIVIVVIAILATLATNVYAGVQREAEVAQAKSHLQSMKKAMLAYKIDFGELPPEGDAWNYDTDPPSESGWLETLTAMETTGYLGTGRAEDLLKDPWGNNYGYDDNDCGSFAGDETPTYLQSMGPNGIDDDTDDVVLLISKGCIY